MMAWRQANGKSSEHEGLEFRFYGEKKLRRSKKETFPLVIYLHGRGGNVMKREEFPDHSSKSFSDEKNYADRPCFVLVPQAKEGGLLERRAGRGQ